VSVVWLDGVVQGDGYISLVDDGVEHSVELNHPRT
jgi:cyclic beta-1,2-glucan synthetase